MKMKVKSIWLADIQQRAFREILECFSRPGEVHDLSQIGGDEHAIKLVLATLMDVEVTLADHCGYLSPKDWSLLEAKRSEADRADFVLVDGLSFPNFEPKKGTLESPEKGCTLLVKVKDFMSGDLILDMCGPGIKCKQTVQIDGLNCDWLYHRNQWVEDFPMGVDMLLISESHIMGIPRTTTIEYKVSK